MRCWTQGTRSPLLSSRSTRTFACPTCDWARPTWPRCSRTWRRRAAFSANRRGKNPRPTNDARVRASRRKNRRLNGCAAKSAASISILSMLFQTPSITESEAEVIDKIEAIRTHLNLPSLREWPGLPWRAIYARGFGANLAGCNVLSEGAIAAAEEIEPVASSEAWTAASSYRAALTFVLQLADDPDFTYDEGIFRALHNMMMEHDPAKTPGRWRRGPMTVYREASGHIVYRAPTAQLIPELIAELIGSLNWSVKSCVVGCLSG